MGAIPTDLTDQPDPTDPTDVTDSPGPPSARLPAPRLFLHGGFIRRQLTSTRSQAAIFVLCVALSLVTLVALRGFGDSVNRALTRDSRTLIAGDVVVRSNFPIPAEIEASIQDIAAANGAQAARTYEFLSVVRRPAEDASVLSSLKVVEPGWPFFGQVELASGRPLTDVLESGRVAVEQNLLDRLGVAVGEPLRIGETTLTIADVLTREPDRPVNFFALGPRVLVHAADLAALQLVQPGSRVTYRWLLRAPDDGAVDRIAAQLVAAVDPELVDVETFRTARTGLERFFTNLLFFLSLVGIFTLLLAGVGIQSSLTAFLRARHTTIAVVKTLGAGSRFVTVNFYAVVLLLGGIGAVLGLALGFLLQWVLPTLLRGFLPPDVELVISARAVLESALLGLAVVLLFTFLPLFQLEELRPSFIFRKEEPAVTRRLPYAATVLLILALFVGLVVWQLDSLRIGLWFAAGTVGLLVVAALLTEAALWLLRRVEPRNLVFRQALRGLFRPRNGTRAIVITLATALGVIFAIFLVEQNLRASFVQSYPPDAPNIFFLDIQPDQREAFAQALGRPAEYTPVVRALLAAVNGQEPAREEDEEEGDRRAPQYSLTYRDTLRPDESVEGGGPLFSPNIADPQVSVLAETLRARQLKLGDRLTFQVEGVPIDATITSVRTQSAESVQPFFSFVLPAAVLAAAPQTIFTGLRVPAGEIAALQNRMVAQFPNVTVIDVTATIAQFAGVVRRITQVVRFFAAFSILAGLLIVVSSVYATRLARVQEAVYYKVLGATRRWVTGVFVLENVLLGLLSAMLALLMAQVAAWLIMKYLFELDYRVYAGYSAFMVAATVAAVTLVGMTASIGILRSRPIAYLRQQGEEE